MDFERYLAGEALYGDDFGESETAAWYADEEEAYAELGSESPASYRYTYHDLNRWHAFRHLPEGRFRRVLGFGSAYGEEFAPIASSIEKLTILDPSDAFARDSVCGIPVTYVKPGHLGQMPFNDGTFDLITCLGVLHHLPNVSFVLRELSRVLRKNAYLVLREPIISMGDWRRPRSGLTKRERGIPLAVLREIANRAHFGIVHESLCIFPVTRRLFHGYNNRPVVWLDQLLCGAFRWNFRYHARNSIEKLRPTSAYMVLRKEDA